MKKVSILDLGRMKAEEEKITLRMETKRDTVAAALEQAERMVEVAVKDFDAETEALVREEEEQGNKRAAEIKAEADRKVASLLKAAEETKAQTVKILGQADADVIEATKKAEAMKLQLLIQAYGGARQYNLATFAESLPDDIKIEYRYAGPGTLWTEMRQSFTENECWICRRAGKEKVWGSCCVSPNSVRRCRARRVRKSIWTTSRRDPVSGSALVGKTFGLRDALA